MREGGRGERGGGEEGLREGERGRERKSFFPYCK